MKFILLINVKMPSIVGILTFISAINTSERLLYLSVYVSFYELLKFCAQFSRARKKFYNLRAWLRMHNQRDLLEATKLAKI